MASKENMKWMSFSKSLSCDMFVARPGRMRVCRTARKDSEFTDGSSSYIIR